MVTDYDAYAKNSPYFYGTQDTNRVAAAVRGRSGHFLEIGAGDGGMLRALLTQSALAAFDSITAVDISAARVDRIRTILPQVNAIIASAEQLPLEAASIDFCYSDQVIEHVPCDQRMTREIYRVLKAGGRALVGSVIKHPGGWYFYRCNGKWTLDPTHLREYSSIDQFRDLFLSAGFTIMESLSTPVRFSLPDLMLRALLRLRIINVDAALQSYNRLRYLRTASALQVRVPRYETCYVLAQKPS